MLNQDCTFSVKGFLFILSLDRSHVKIHLSLTAISFLVEDKLKFIKRTLHYPGTILWKTLPSNLKQCHDHIVVGFTTTYVHYIYIVHMQSVPITTKVVNLNLAHGKVYLIQH